MLIIYVIWPVSASASVDVALTVAANPAVVVVNRTAFVFAEVFNFGDETATDVIVTANLPAEVSLVQATTTVGVCSGNPVVVCSLGNLPSGTLAKQTTISVEVILNQTGSVKHTFSLATSAAETELTNNSATVTIESVNIDESADLGISFGLMPITAFQRVLFSVPLNIINHGPQGVSDVEVVFRTFGLTLADLESATPSQGICVTDLTNCIGLSCMAALQSALKIRCEPGTLSSGQQASIDVSFYPSSDAGEFMSLTVDVHDGNRADPDLNNNSSSQQVEIVPLMIPNADFQGPYDPILPIGIGCFIATAAYGSDMHEDVILLRQFRDNYLMKNEWSRMLVETYYRYSPRLAEAIRTKSEYRAFVRVLLKPIIWVIRHPWQAMMLTLLFVVMFLPKRFNRYRKD